MKDSARGWIQRSVAALAVLVVGATSVWVYGNRGTLAAACINTVNGISSKIAHLNEPFGVGGVVAEKNPVLGTVPEFTLANSSGGTVRREDLLGSYWVASFIFTRCATTCPMAVTELADMQGRLPHDVRLVSITVDPEYDSPEVLSDYAKRVGADVDRWLFLTGDKDDIYRCIREGFQLAVQENTNGKPGWEVTHSPRFALVDPKGRVRGYYESSNPEDMNRLVEDVTRLVGRNHRNT